MDTVDFLSLESEVQASTQNVKLNRVRQGVTVWDISGGSHLR